MSSPNKPPFDSKGKAKLNESGSHSIVRAAQGSLQSVKSLKVGSGQTWSNLMKSDVDEYARAQAGGGNRGDASRGLLGDLIARVRGIFVKSS